MQEGSVISTICFIAGLVIGSALGFLVTAIIVADKRKRDLK